MSLLTGGLDARAERAIHSLFPRIAAAAAIVALTSTPALGQNFGAFDDEIPVFSDSGIDLANPDIAIGPDTIVAIGSSEIAWFNRNMAWQGGSPLTGPGGLWEDVASPDGLVDPQVIFNEQAQRFYVVASGPMPDGTHAMHFAASLTSDPSDGWFTRHLQSGLIDRLTMGAWADGLFLVYHYPDGNANWWLFTTAERLFNTDRRHFFGGKMVSGSLSYAGDTVGDERMVVAAAHPGMSGHVRLEGTTDSDLGLGRSVVALIPIPFQQSQPPQIPQPGGGLIDIGGMQFRSAKVMGDSCWLAQTIGKDGRAIVRWYEIGLHGWPNSGNIPSVAQTGDIDMGDGVHAFLPDIAADTDGNAAIVFNVASTNQSVSLARAVRFSDDPSGEFRSPFVFKLGGVGAVADGPWGAYVGVEADPDEPGVFWSHAPMQENSGWKTWISKVTLAEEEPPSDGPRLNSPDNGFIDYVIPIIQWNFDDLASGFRVQVSDQPGFGNGTFTSQTIQGNSYEIPDGLIDCNKRYYWRVIAETPHGDIMSEPESRWFERRIRQDLNGDGIVDSADLGLLIAAFNSAGPVADFNGDGWVNSSDLGSLISAFGRTCD